MATYRTTGFIIKRTDFGEADRILTIFTQYKGKVSAIAKGVRKMESRKGGNVELFNLTRFQLAEGKTMDIVLEAEVEASYQKLREDLHLVSLVYQLVELVDQFIQEDQANSIAFLLFKQAIESLNDSPTEDAARKILAYFQINFLTSVGFKPELNQCVKCGDKLVEEGTVFSPHLGGVVDSKDRGTVVSGMEISIEAIKTLRFFQIEGWSKAKRLKIDEVVLPEVENLLQNYLEFVLEKELRTVAFTRKTRTV